MPTLLRFVGVEVPVCDDSGAFAYRDGCHADDRLRHGELQLCRELTC
jgi:hypothetical protein